MNPWEHFTDEELECRDGCGLGWQNMDPNLMSYLNQVRERTGIPFPVTSAVRCHAHDDKCGGQRAHTIQDKSGKAHGIDIALDRTSFFLVFSILFNEGFLTGFGLRQHGDRRFLHVDNLWAVPTRRVRPIIWTYP